MQFDKDQLASNLMEAITTGLYSRKLDCIREYVQNSYDARATEVEISIENGVHCVIEDNGSGMDWSELIKALGVGPYNKKPDDEGTFGIGIWSGVAVSSKLVIITKKKKIAEKLKISIDSDYIRNNARKNIDLLKFLTDVTSDIEKLPVSETEINNSFTIIRLENLIDDVKTDLFTPKNILDYASKNLPVPIVPSWKYSKIVYRGFDRKYMHEMKLNVKEKNRLIEVYRHMDLKDQTLKPEIKEFKIGDKVVATGWFALNKEFSTLPEGVRGIYYKHNGFTVGTWSDLKGEIGTNFNEWWVGEIHVHDVGIRPTTDRSAFQPVPWINDFYKEVKGFLQSLQGINRSLSDNITSPTRQMDGIKKLENPASKWKSISSIESKNFKQSADITAKIPEFKELNGVVKNKVQRVKTRLAAMSKQIKQEKNKTDPSRIDLKKMLKFLSPKGDANTITSLLEEEHEGKMSIDPFQSLKEKIEKKSGKKFSSFSLASEVIGGFKGDKTEVKSLLSLFKGSKDEKGNNKDVQKFFKSFNKIFRDYFEHAQGTPQTIWFEGLDNDKKMKVKYLILSTVALISYMIDFLEKQ